MSPFVAVMEPVVAVTVAPAPILIVWAAVIESKAVIVAGP